MSEQYFYKVLYKKTNLNQKNIFYFKLIAIKRGLDMRVIRVFLKLNLVLISNMNSKLKILTN